MAAAVVAALAIACGVRPEQPVLEQFFGESRLRDLTALQKFSDVVFEPARDGIVRRFDIVSVAPMAGTGERVTVSADVAWLDGSTRGETIDVTLDRRGDDWRVTGFTVRATAGQQD